MAGVIEELTLGLKADSLPLERLVVALTNSGAVDRMVEGLEAKSAHHRAAGARAIGALLIYEAVPSVAPLLAARERPVSDAAARALGRIGGAHSAGALLFALQRRGISRRLVAELARGAPAAVQTADMFGKDFGQGAQIIGSEAVFVRTTLDARKAIAALKNL